MDPRDVAYRIRLALDLARRHEELDVALDGLADLADELEAIPEAIPEGDPPADPGPRTCAPASAPDTPSGGAPARPPIPTCPACGGRLPPGRATCSDRCRAAASRARRREVLAGRLDAAMTAIAEARAEIAKA